jgi:hypothetical protein
MNLRRVRFILSGLMFLIAGKCHAQHVKTDYDHRANFAEYKSYSWETAKTQDVSSANRIKMVVNAALANKGLILMDSGGAVSIVAVEITRDQETLDSFYDSFAPTWGWRHVGTAGFRATSRTDKYKTGTLVVDLFDAKTKRLLWRASSTDALFSTSGDNSETLEKGIRKMFRWFPPTPSPSDAASRDDRPE